jgi:hypothetical protein
MPHRPRDRTRICAQPLKPVSDPGSLICSGVAGTRHRADHATRRQLAPERAVQFPVWRRSTRNPERTYPRVAALHANLMPNSLNPVWHRPVRGQTRNAGQFGVRSLSLLRRARSTKLESHHEPWKICLGSLTFSLPRIRICGGEKGCAGGGGYRDWRSSKPESERPHVELWTHGRR